MTARHTQSNAPPEADAPVGAVPSPRSSPDGRRVRKDICTHPLVRVRTDQFCPSCESPIDTTAGCKCSG